MNDMKGIPWQPHDGMRHKINRELSQPVALPAPAAAGPTALASEPPEKEAEDGQNVDQDGPSMAEGLGMERTTAVYL